MIFTQQYFERSGLAPNKPGSYYLLAHGIAAAEIGCAAADHLLQKHCVTSIPGEALYQQDPGMSYGRASFSAENRDIEQRRARIRS